MAANRLTSLVNEPRGYRFSCTVILAAKLYDPLRVHLFEAPGVRPRCTLSDAPSAYPAAHDVTALEKKGFLRLIGSFHVGQGQVGQDSVPAADVFLKYCPRGFFVVDTTRPSTQPC